MEREAGNREIEEVRVEEEEEDSHPNEDLLGEQTAFISKVSNILLWPAFEIDRLDFES